MSEFRRQHWAAAVDQVFNVIRRNLIYLIVLFFVGNSQSESNLFWYILLGGIAASLLSGIFSWLLFTYRIDGSELHIRKGIFVRKDLYLSKDRIQVIDVTEGIIQRIFGLVKVEIKTAGSGTAGATISAITLEEAERLRTELRKEESKTEQPEVEPGEESSQPVEQDEILDEWRISQKDLVMAALTSGNFGLIASILGAAAGQLDVFINEENINYLVEKLPGFNNFTLILTIVAVVFLISWVLSFLGVIFRYGDFKVIKTEKELLVTSGLIERRHSTIPFNRIQAVRFVEGLLRQPLGHGMVYVESAGFEVNQKERSIVMVPYIAKDELESFFGRFLQDYKVSGMDVKPPQRAFFRYLRRPNYLLLMVLAGLAFFWEYWWLPALLMIPFTYLGYLQYRDAGLSFNSEMIALSYRKLARTSAYILRKRIQALDERVNPFQDRKDLSTLQVTAASGAKGIEFSVHDLDKENLRMLREWLISAKSPEPEPAYDHES